MTPAPGITLEHCLYYLSHLFSFTLPRLARKEILTFITSIILPLKHNTLASLQMAMVKRINNLPTVKLAKQALPLLTNPKLVNKAIDVVPLVVQGGQKLSKAAKRLLGAYGGNISYTEGAKPGAISAPVAISRRVAGMKPRFVRSEGSVKIVHREFIASVLPSNDLTVNNGDVNVGKYRVNPSNNALFTWLQGQAQLYDMYRFTRLRITYIPTTGSTSTGRVSILWDRDSQDPLPIDRAAISSYAHYADSAPWAENVLVVPCDNTWRYMNDTNAVDRKLVDFGQFLFATYSGDGSTAHGDLYVEYAVEFKDPQPIAGMVCMFDRLVSFSEVGSTIKGVNYIADRDVITTGGNIGVNINIPGTYLVTIVLNATSIGPLTFTGNSKLVGNSLNVTSSGASALTFTLNSTGVPNSSNSSFSVGTVVALTRVRMTITRCSPETAYLA